MLYFLAESLNLYGGDDGLNIARASSLGGAIDLGDPVERYYFVFAWLLAFLYLGHRLVHSRFGLLLQGVKSNERRMAAIGFPTFRYKLAAFVIAGTACGVAGALYANALLFVSPSIMHWTRSGEIMMMVILGGMATLVGPVLGAALYLILESVLPRATEHWQAILGPILVLVVLFSRERSPGAPCRWHEAADRRPCLRRSSRRRASSSAMAASSPPAPCRWRSRRASSTPSSGPMAPARRRSSPNSPARSRPTPAASASPAPTSRREASPSAPPSASRAPFRSPASSASSRCSTTWHSRCRPAPGTASASGGRRGAIARLRDPARAILAEVGLAARAELPAASLSHGEKRALEIAIVLATRPRLLLLDEPMAGMGPQDAAGMVRLLAGLKRRVTIVLVEHDMDAVFALADRITVLVYGRVIATGAPAAIREDAEVRRAYLGEEARLMLRVAGLEASYGDEPGAVRRRSRDRRAARW